MSRIKSFFKRYIPFTRGVFESHLSYRMSVFLWTIGDLFSLLVMYFVWDAIYKNSDHPIINGYTFLGMIAYMIVVHIVGLYTNMNPLWYVTDDFNEGRIAMALIKPISYRLQLFFQNLGEQLFGNIFVATPLMIILIVLSFFVDFELHFSVVQLLLFFVSILFAMVVNFLANFIFANLVFYTQATFGVWQLNMIVIRIFSGALIPIVFFPGWLKGIAMFLPYMQVQYTPTLIFLNRLSQQDMIMALLQQVMWIGILLVISEILWRHAVKRLVVMGG